MLSDDKALVICKSCQRKFRWQEKYAGKRVRCKCDQVVEFPLTDPSIDLNSGSSLNDDSSYDLHFDSSDSTVSLNSPFNSESSAGDSSMDYDLFGSDDSAQNSNDHSDIGLVLNEGPKKPDNQPACPQCEKPLRIGAIICTNCGFNLQEGKSIKSDLTGQKEQKARKTLSLMAPSGFFGKLSNSWEYAKISYGIIWDFKPLLVFPVLAGISALLILASFVIPLWQADVFDQLFQASTSSTSANTTTTVTLKETSEVVHYLTAFAFYFCNYFSIVFFNTALIACAMKVIQGEKPTIGYGLSIAVKRLPQIFAWALLSALVGTVLKFIENTHEKAGRIVAAILGTGWTILTYFVIPVLVIEGAPPFKAIKQSLNVMKETWGESLLGNYSLSLLGFLIAIPLYLVVFVTFYLAISMENSVLIATALALGFLVTILVAAINSAADIIFKALLYNFATGQSIPANIDQDIFAKAFAISEK